MILLIVLALLDADRFATREAATKALTRLAPWYWRELYAMESVSFEVQWRCRQVADKHWPKVPLAERQEYVAQFRPKGWSMLPWLCVAEGSCHLSGRTGPRGCWVGYREATEMWLYQAVEWLPPDAIRAELERMAAAELEWIAANLEAYRYAGGQRRLVR